MTLGILTLGILALGILALGILALGILTLAIMTLGIITQSIVTFNDAIKMRYSSFSIVTMWGLNDTRHFDTQHSNKKYNTQHLVYL